MAAIDLTRLLVPRPIALDAPSDVAPDTPGDGAPADGGAAPRLVLPGDAGFAMPKAGAPHVAVARPGVGASPALGTAHREVVALVYAREDRGCLSPGSRHKPHKVGCAIKQGAPLVDHVVKPRRDALGAAAAIADLIGALVLRAAGVRALEPRLVDGMPGVRGLSFGTVFRGDVEQGPPSSLARLADAQELVDIWVLDTALHNIDRAVAGNLLLEPEDDGSGRVHLIAADNSDLFGGAGRLVDGSALRTLDDERAAASVPFLDAAVLQAGGARAIASALDKAKRARAALPRALAAVPAAWWAEAGVDARALEHKLNERFWRLPRLVGEERYRALDDALRATGATSAPSLHVDAAPK